MTEENPWTKYDEPYENTVIPEASPDGKYQAVLVGLEQKKTEPRDPEAEKKDYLGYTWLIIGEEQRYTTCYSKAFLTGRSLEFTKRDLIKLGFTGRISDLYTPDGRAQLLGACVIINQVTKPQKDNPEYTNTNYYIQKKIQIDANDLEQMKVAAQGSGAAVDEEIPF